MVKMCRVETAKDTLVDSQNDSQNADLPATMVAVYSCPLVHECNNDSI